MPSTARPHHPASANDEILAPAVTAPSPLDTDADAAPYGEAFEVSREDVPMLRDEVHLPGVRRETFAPELLFRRNAVPRDDVDPFDDTLFLVEQPLRRIAKDGIHLGGQVYFDELLETLVTGPDGTPRRTLVMLYNAAQLSRGVLEEVRVCERDAAGRLIELCRCPTRATYLARTDPAARVKTRIAYQRGLAAGVALAQETLTEVRSGTEARVHREDEHAARDVRRRGMRFEPRVAEPRHADDPQDKARAAARDARQRVTSISEKLGPSARGRAAGPVAADAAATTPGVAGAAAPARTRADASADAHDDGRADSRVEGREDGRPGRARSPERTESARDTGRPRRARGSAGPRPGAAPDTTRTTTPDPLLNGASGPLPLREATGAEHAPPATRQARLASMLGGRTGFARRPASPPDR
jgi:hypothetical protein